MILAPLSSKYLSSRSRVFFLVFDVRRTKNNEVWKQDFLRPPIIHNTVIATATSNQNKHPSNMSKNLQSLIYTNEGGTSPQLSVLDQLLIPHEKVYINIPDSEMAWSVIRKMNIRGAPLIAIVAMLGLSVDLHTNPKTLKELDSILIPMSWHIFRKKWLISRHLVQLQ